MTVQDSGNSRMWKPCVKYTADTHVILGGCVFKLALSGGKYDTCKQDYMWLRLIME